MIHVEKLFCMYSNCLYRCFVFDILCLAVAACGDSMCAYTLACTVVHTCIHICFHFASNVWSTHVKQRQERVWKGERVSVCVPRQAPLAQSLTLTHTHKPSTTCKHFLCEISHMQSMYENRTLNKTKTATNCDCYVYIAMSVSMLHMEFVGAFEFATVRFIHILHMNGPGPKFLSPFRSIVNNNNRWFAHRFISQSVVSVYSECTFRAFN